MINGNPTALKRATCFLVRASWDKVHGLDPTMVEITSFLPHKRFRARKASVIQVLSVPDFMAALRCRHWQGIGDTLLVKHCMVPPTFHPPLGFGRGGSGFQPQFPSKAYNRH